MTRSSPPRHLTAFGLVMAVLGIALFVWLVWRLGPGAIWTGFGQIGWGLAFIVALGGLRFAARAFAWRLCFEPPARLRFSDAFAAVLAGDALGNVIPLGPLISEPAKAAFVRERTDIVAAVTALAVENLFYTLSVAAMLAASTIVLLFSVELPGPLRQMSEVALAVIIALIAAAMWVLRRRPAVVSRALGRFGTADDASLFGRRLQRVQRLEEQIFSFSSRRKGVVAPLIAMEVLFHLLGVLEVYVTLMLLLGAAPSLLTAFLLEGANRLITVIFKLIPLRVGVDEAGTEWLAQILGLGIATGATIAIVRKARVLFWIVVGGVLLVRQGLSARRILEDSQLAAERQR